MASNYCTIIQRDGDGGTFCYQAKKKNLKNWLKQGIFRGYSLLDAEDLNKECDLAYHEEPFVIILDGCKHLPLKNLS